MFPRHSKSAFITEDGKLREEKIVRENRPFTFFLRCVTKKTGIRDGLERLGKIELKAVNISFHVFGKPTNDEWYVFSSFTCTRTPSHWKYRGFILYESDDVNVGMDWAVVFSCQSRAI